jgi:flagellar assembly factor FliW
MRVNTKAYGQIDVDERQKLFFPHGLMGFEKLQDYVLLDAPQKPFYWLQSLDVVEIAFVLIDPLLFRPEYALSINQDELEEIAVTGADDMLVFSIVTIPENAERMTANLQGPVIINRKSRVGRQSINNDARWKVRHFIMEELASLRQGAG